MRSMFAVVGAGSFVTLSPRDTPASLGFTGDSVKGRRSRGAGGGVRARVMVVVEEDAATVGDGSWTGDGLFVTPPALAPGGPTALA